MGIRFRSIGIDGYRGRNFRLDVPKGQSHAIFEMDGSTGKTTTIELLRWCFIYKESQAEGKFRHMWVDPAHVLDWDKKGKQECRISIDFEDDSGTLYSYERVTKGKHDRSKRKESLAGDIISSIEDSLEIDRGKRVIRGDDVQEFLNSEFRLGVSAEYLCFDGEKAREMMILATQVSKLIERVKERTTHQHLLAYLDALDDLEDRLLGKIGRVDSKRSISITNNSLDKKRKLKTESQKRLKHYQDQIDVYSGEIEKIKERIKDIRQAKIKALSTNATEKVNIENEIRSIRKDFEAARMNVYDNWWAWTRFGSLDELESVKERIREHGKLPEPYRKDLIDACLAGETPVCQICGRAIDKKETLERVRELGRQVASHRIQKFLTSSPVREDLSFDPKSKRKEILEHVEKLGVLDSRLELIQLSPADQELFSNLGYLEESKELLAEKLGKAKGSFDDEEAILEMAEKEFEVAKEKSEGYRINKPLYDEIEHLRTILRKTNEEIRSRTIDAISKVISKAVKNILGDTFSATLDEEEGLMLGEKDIYGPEVGGYSGRLILSYLFAEAMSQVDPIIIDTPVGNVGSHRAALAKHLVNNHPQVMLLCLPTELDDFAEYFSAEVEKIENPK